MPFRRFLTLVVTLTLFTCFGDLFAVQNSDSSPNQGEEVYLSFRYKGAVNTVVTAIAKDEQFYLPVTELFSLLKIDYKLNIQDMSISGYYLDPDGPIKLAFRRNSPKSVIAGSKSLSMR